MRGDNLVEAKRGKLKKKHFYSNEKYHVITLQLFVYPYTTDVIYYSVIFTFFLVGVTLRTLNVGETVRAPADKITIKMPVYIVY